VRLTILYSFTQRVLPLVSFDPITIASVEVGTSKIAVILAEYSGDGFTIQGWGECRAQGVRKGVVEHYADCSQCTVQALEVAKRNAEVETIDRAFLALTGGHLQGFPSEASLAVSSADNMVSAREVEQLRQLALAKELPEGRMLLQSLRRPFRLDGRLLRNSPEHLAGHRLELAYWLIHGDQHRVSDSVHMVTSSDIPVVEMALSSVCSGRVVTSRREREDGVLVLDIGAGTTDYVLYRYGAPYVAGVVAVGGDHLSSDLTTGLRLSVGQGDRVKLRHGRATVQCRDKAQKVWLDGDGAIGDRQLPLVSIEKILELRVRELFEVVRQSLGADFAPEHCAAGVVLTGGTSKLPGIADVAAEVFGVPAQLGKVSAELPETLQEELREPGYHAVLGLLLEGIEQQRGHFATEQSQRGGFFRRLFSRH